MSGSLGLMPFNNISNLPKDAKWNPVSDYEHEATINSTEIYELTWIEKDYMGSPVLRKWQFTIDPETNLPLDIQCYRKSDADAQFILNSRITIKYLDNSAMQSAIEKYF